MESGWKRRRPQGSGSILPVHPFDCWATRCPAFIFHLRIASSDSQKETVPSAVGGPNALDSQKPDCCETSHHLSGHFGVSFLNACVAMR